MRIVPVSSWRICALQGAAHGRLRVTKARRTDGCAKPRRGARAAAWMKGGIIMYRGLGFLAAGIAVGLLVTGYLVEKELHDEKTPEAQQDGLFAEVRGNTVRLYRVENGRFGGYSEPKVFESSEKAVEWVMKDTKAKLVFAEE